MWSELEKNLHYLKLNIFCDYFYTEFYIHLYMYLLWICFKTGFVNFFRYLVKVIVFAVVLEIEGGGKSNITSISALGILSFFRVI